MRDLARLLGFVRPYSLRIAAAVALMAVVGACYGLFALLLEPLLDRFLNPSPVSGPIDLIEIPFTDRSLSLEDVLPVSGATGFGAFCAVFALISVGKGLCDYAASYLVNFAGYAAVRDLRNAMYESVLHQSPAFFQDRHTGELISSLVSDIEKIQSACSHFLADLMRQLFTTAALLLVLLQHDALLTAGCSLLVPIVLLPASRIGRRLRRTSTTVQDYLAQLVKLMQETIAGNRLVKAFQAERIEVSRFRRRANRLLRESMSMVKQQAVVSPLIEVLGAAMILGLLVYVRMRILAGEMTAGEVVSFIVALVMLLQPVKRLIGIHNIFQQALGAIQRAFAYMDHPVEVADAPRAEDLAAVQHSIELDNVRFTYPGARDAALDSVTLRVRAREVVALVGPSGAGKTTLMSLLPRFFDPTDGAIRIDGRDLRSVTIESLRRQIAIVTQDTVLFDDTVHGNIAYGQPGASRNKVRAAATAAYAIDFIGKLPQGFQTPLGEGGLRLSGGQRQRIAIARALLKDAPILLLDEATSHLDSDAEMLVQRALTNLIRGRTVIVSAHRLSTVRSADRIVVLEGGRIVDRGSHASLLETCKLYRHLVELQSIAA